MSNIVIVAGYTKKSYLSKIRSYFENSDTIVACAYTRQPYTEAKEGYLALFDTSYNLNKQTDRDKLKDLAPSVKLITCTEERDMVAYIEAQLICGKINDVQAHNYTALIDKEYFKKSLQKIYPQFIPDLQVITPELLLQLDSLTYPIVIKPTGLAGSTLIKIVSNAEEFKTHYESFSDTMLKFGKEIYQKDIHIIAETYISGPQFSMNVYVNKEGAVTFCPVVRVIPSNELGFNDTYSALQYTTDELSTEELETLKDSIRKIIVHFKVTCTSMHFDCVLNNGQWKFFEVGLRIGGNRQKLFELSNDMDHFLNDLKNRLGETVVMQDKVKSACIIQKAATIHGTLTKVSYSRVITAPEKTLIIENKISQIGKVTGPVSTGGGTITRHFLSGKDHEEVIEVSKRLFDGISFELS
jgi:hypothetical protein